MPTAVDPYRARYGPDAGRGCAGPPSFPRRRNGAVDPADLRGVLGTAQRLVPPLQLAKILYQPVEADEPLGRVEDRSEHQPGQAVPAVPLEPDGQVHRLGPPTQDRGVALEDRQ